MELEYSSHSEKQVAEIQRNNAQQAQLKAEMNYRSAKSTVDRLLFNVTQTIELSQGIRTETINHLLDAVKTTIDILIEENLDDLDLRASESTMLDEFAKCYLAAGALTRATTVAKQSLAIMGELLTKEPANEFFAVSRIESIVRLGQMYFQGGNTREAEILFKAADEARTILTERHPSNKEADGLTAAALVFLGNIALTQEILRQPDRFLIRLLRWLTKPLVDRTISYGSSNAWPFRKAACYLEAGKSRDAENAINDEAIILGRAATRITPDKVCYGNADGRSDGLYGRIGRTRRQHGARSQNVMKRLYP